MSNLQRIPYEMLHGCDSPRAEFLVGTARKTGFLALLVAAYFDEARTHSGKPCGLRCSSLLTTLLGKLFLGPFQ